MNARSTTVLLPALLLALAAVAASGQEKPKLYRWVDKQGQVHYGDSVPPEYGEQDRDVLNKQGVKVGREEGTITPEEAAAKTAEEKAPREEQKRNTVTTYGAGMHRLRVRDTPSVEHPAYVRGGFGGEMDRACDLVTGHFLALPEWPQDRTNPHEIVS